MKQRIMLWLSLDKLEQPPGAKTMDICKILHLDLVHRSLPDQKRSVLISGNHARLINMREHACQHLDRSDRDILVRVHTSDSLKHQREVKHVAMDYWFVCNRAGQNPKLSSLRYDPHVKFPPLCDCQTENMYGDIAFSENAMKSQYGDEAAEMWRHWLNTEPSRSVDTPPKHKTESEATPGQEQSRVENSTIFREPEGSCDSSVLVKPGDAGFIVSDKINTAETLLEAFDSIEEQDPAMRISLAQNESTPLNILARLSEDYDPRVRACVAANRATPLRMLHPLSKDYCLEVSIIARISENRLKSGQAPANQGSEESLWDKDLRHTWKSLITDKAKCLMKIQKPHTA